jgi:hypothetical protein
MNQNFLSNNPLMQNIMGMQSRALVTTSQGSRITSKKKMAGTLQNTPGVP